MKKIVRLVLLLGVLALALSAFALPKAYHRAYLGYHPPYCGIVSDDGCDAIDVEP